MSSSNGNKWGNSQKITKGDTTAQPPSGWTTPAGEVNVSNTRITGNQSGVVIETAQPLVASNTEFSANQAWGVKLRGPFTLSNCTVDSNGEGGVLAREMKDGDLNVNQLQMTNNRTYGFLFENSTLTIGKTLASRWTISGSSYVMASQGGTLTLDGVTVQKGSVAGVYTHQGTLVVRNCTLTDNGYGVAGDESSVTVDASTLTRNAVGLYANRNALVSLKNSTLSSNSLWGAIVYASTAPGATASFDGCTVSNNAGGISLLNAENGAFTLKDTVVRDNSQSGLHLENCNLTINNQAANNWQTLRNLYGISAKGSTLTLEHLTIDGSTSYGVHSTDSNVTLRYSMVSGRDGVRHQGSGGLVVDACRLSSNVSGAANWGVYQAGGSAQLKNVLLNGFESGIYLQSDNGQQASVWNTTIANTTRYGAYVAGGNAELRNTIVYGSGGVGIAKAGGNLLHSHNLVHGFTTPFQGTTAHDTDLVKNPRFANAASGDFRLAMGSPAINAGADLSASVSSDLDGNARPAFDAFEIGAYEYMDDTGSFRVLTWSEQR
jgi:hypothetical protein